MTCQLVKLVLSYSTECGVLYFLTCSDGDMVGTGGQWQDVVLAPWLVKQNQWQPVHMETKPIALNMGF